jgi:hypothetical protein
LCAEENFDSDKKRADREEEGRRQEKEKGSNFSQVILGK